MDDIPQPETAEEFEARVAPLLEPERPASELKWHGDVDDTPLKEWLVDRMLPRVGKALMAGQWGVYKTFVALDLSRAVMTGSPFAGRAARRQGGVLFIAAEGQDEVRVRLAGLARNKLAETQLDVVPVDPEHLPFTWIETCPLLTANEALEKLCAIVAEADAEMQRRFNLPVVLIIIDTLMPAAGFRDANDSSEAQRVMSVLTAVALKFGALVLAVDHFGKDVTTGTRNSSVKEDAVDAVLALLAERDVAGKITNPRMAVRKVRGAPTGEEIHFTTRVVVVAENAGFDAISTLVVDWNPGKPHHAEGAPEPTKNGGGRSLPIFCKALDYTLADTGQRMRPYHDGPEVMAAKRNLVRAEFLKNYPADNAKAKGKAFLRCEMEAVENRVVGCREIGDGECGETFFWLLET